MRARALTSSATAHAAFYFSLALARSTHIIYSYIYYIYTYPLAAALSRSFSAAVTAEREVRHTPCLRVSLSLHPRLVYIYFFLIPIIIVCAILYIPTYSAAQTCMYACVREGHIETQCARGWHVSWLRLLSPLLLSGARRRVSVATRDPRACMCM